MRYGLEKHSDVLSLRSSQTTRRRSGSLDIHSCEPSTKQSGATLPFSQFPSRERYSKTDSFSSEKNRPRFFSSEDLLHPSFFYPLLNSSSYSVSSIRPLTAAPPALEKLLPNIRSSMSMNIPFFSINQGLSGTYFVRDSLRNNLAVFKPIDEEPFNPLNKKGFNFSLDTVGGLRKSVKAGEGALREVAASLLDGGYHGVPETSMVLLKSQNFARSMSLSEIDCDGMRAAMMRSALNGVKVGSLQRAVTNVGTVEDFSENLFDIKDVQKIALLDLRILNKDRNSSNILVSKLGGRLSLTPIDHGLSMPSKLGLEHEELCWLNWPQAKKTIDAALFEMILRLDPKKDCDLLEDQLGIGSEELKIFRISEEFLKLAVKKGLNVFQIAQFYLTNEASKNCLLEEIVKQAEELSAPLYKKFSKTTETLFKKLRKTSVYHEKELPSNLRSSSLDLKMKKIKEEDDRTEVFFDCFRKIAKSHLAASIEGNMANSQ